MTSKKADHLTPGEGAPKNRRISRAEKLAAVREVVEKLTADGQKKLDQFKKVTQKRARGRPTLFTPAMGVEICRRLVEQGSLRRVCAADDMPAFGTVYTWDYEGQEDIAADKKDSEKAAFTAQFARAREMQAHAMVAEARDIADDGSNDWQISEKGYSLNHEHVSRSSLRVNTLFKMAEKLAPRIYAPLQKMADADGGKLPTVVTPLEIILTTKTEKPDE